MTAPTSLLFQPEHTPLVSIVIPSKTPGPRADLLAHTMASVFGQTMTDFEYIVKGSPTYWGHKVNQAFAGTCGKYGLILCDDDKLKPYCLEAMVERAEQGYDVVSSDVQLFGDRSDVHILPPWSRETFCQTTACWITTLFRMDLWREVGGFDPAQHYQDWDYFYRLFQINARHFRIHRPLWDYRLHDDAGSNHMDHTEAHRLMYAKHPELAAA